jgi:hypothetical protein
MVLGRGNNVVREDARSRWEVEATSVESWAKHDLSTTGTTFVSYWQLPWLLTVDIAHTSG